MSSLENGLRILTLFNRERSVLRVTEVCRELDLPKSSVSRLFKTLEEFGLVERNSVDAGYVPGVKVLALADSAVSGRSLLNEVNIGLGDLVSEFQFVGYASVRSGSDIIVLRAKAGSYPLRLMHEIGSRMPALPTAMGITLLSRESDEAIFKTLASAGENRDQDEIRRMMEDARRDGIYALKNGMRAGISAIGAAVHDPVKKERIAFAISYPTDAVDGELTERMKARVRAMALRIGQSVGDAYWISRTETIDTASEEQHILGSGTLPFITNPKGGL